MGNNDDLLSLFFKNIEKYFVISFFISYFALNYICE